MKKIIKVTVDKGRDAMRKVYVVREKPSYSAAHFADVGGGFSLRASLFTDFSREGERLTTFILR